ncbi:hypothetical protein [Ignatzschineria sp. LJL83]
MKQRSNTIIFLYLLLAIILSPLLYYMMEPYSLSLPIIENLQLVLLGIGIIYSLWLAKKQQDYRFFWLWITLFWIILLGRSINWGRIYFPGYPREYYRLIGLCLVSLVVLPLAIRKYRLILVSIIKTYGIPYKVIGILLILFLLADQAEHQRALYLFTNDLIPLPNYELLEEILEIFFMLALFGGNFFYVSKFQQAAQSSPNSSKIGNSISQSAI